MSDRFCLAAFLTAVLLGGTPLAAQSAQRAATNGPDASTLPGGASQLQEIHGDWRVACVQEGDRRLCSLVQQQVQKESGQLVVGIELKTMPGNAVEGTIVLPFGVAVSQPVTLLLDDTQVLTQPFRTCLPVGCLVALSLPSDRVALFTRAAVLTVKAATVAPGQDVTFRISLNGFGSALARTADLTR